MGRWVVGWMGGWVGRSWSQLVLPSSLPIIPTQAFVLGLTVGRRSQHHSFSRSGSRPLSKAYPKLHVLAGLLPVMSLFP